MRRTKKKFPVRRRPPHYGVCPTCQRPWDGVEGSPVPPPSVPQAPQQPSHVAEIKQQQPPNNGMDTSDIFACPFLPPDLLQPVAKYPRKYLPFVSGQNSSAPTVFTILGSAGPAAAAGDRADGAKETTEPQETYDEFADDLY